MTKEERAYNYASTCKATKFQVGEIAKHYNNGYEQAEKDLALTWEDVNLIDSILIDMQDEGVERYGGLRQYYEEALKRFNEQREKK